MASARNCAGVSAPASADLLVLVGSQVSGGPVRWRRARSEKPQVNGLRREDFDSVQHGGLSVVGSSARLRWGGSDRLGDLHASLPVRGLTRLAGFGQCLGLEGALWVAVFSKCASAWRWVSSVFTRRN